MWIPLTFHWHVTQLYKYTNTHTDSLYRCGFLHTHNTPTTMTWRGLHHAAAYTYSTTIYPWALTAHCLCHCGVARAPLPVCLSVGLSISLSENGKWQEQQSLKWSQRCFEVTSNSWCSYADVYCMIVCDRVDPGGVTAHAFISKSQIPVHLSSTCSHYAK